MERSNPPDVVEVHGGNPLGGTVNVSGFKHSLVTCVAAACLGRAPVTITNCPSIVETRTLVSLLSMLGARVNETVGTLALDGSTLSSPSLDPGLANAIHGSVYLAPAILARFGEVHVPGTGGCQIGDSDDGRRPMSHYVDVAARFGARAEATPDGGFSAAADRLRGSTIDLTDYTTDRASRSGPHYSGATKMAILLAATGSGTTVLRNPYPKPDTTDMVWLLREMGSDIETAADGALLIRGTGPAELGKPARVALPPDLIEIMTWICAGATLCPDGLSVTGEGMARALAGLAPELAVLDTMGVRVELVGERLVVAARGIAFRATDVVVTSCGVFSDSHPFLALLACHAAGVTRIEERVWRRRFGYVPALRQLGVTMDQHGGALLVRGPCPPSVPGQSVSATDLRAAAVLLLGALQVPGPTRVSGLAHLARGYRDLPADLMSLGADLRYR